MGLIIITSLSFVFIYYHVVLSAVLIIAGGFIIATAEAKSPQWASITIILLNQITPRVVRWLTSMEYHRSETTRTASEYLKITAFRWVNYVIILAVLNPFVNTLSPNRLIIIFFLQQLKI